MYLDRDSKRVVLVRHTSGGFGFGSAAAAVSVWEAGLEQNHKPPTVVQPVSLEVPFRRHPRKVPVLLLVLLLSKSQNRMPFPDEMELKTGEEDEVCVLEVRAKTHQFVEKKQVAITSYETRAVHPLYLPHRPIVRQRKRTRKWPKRSRCLLLRVQSKTKRRKKNKPKESQEEKTSETVETKAEKEEQEQKPKAESSSKEASRLARARYRSTSHPSKKQGPQSSSTKT